ncbi:hypothetical protein [Alkalihalobacillus trypoxylicola]|uniref:Uncharacterized protein n=1 Tax=Alkalihalobacillus trypoxylicola TaxID=519424 RepID=A0A161P9F4_9BACI|nr:hypothetical protein [Alkalihalobacillus trypoxylicola]KYG28164.1 hypothetical protein AZF04_09685 [Alkalihalobacillus trypoxylicola]
MYTDEREFWEKIKRIAESLDYITTFKGNAEAEIVEVNNNSIDIRLKKDNNLLEINRNVFLKALSIVNEKGRVRQADIKEPTVERYVLGFMLLLPKFDKLKEIQGSDTISYLIYK